MDDKTWRGVHIKLTMSSALWTDAGPRQVLFCGVVQYANLLGTSIGYTITAASSMVYDSYLPCNPQSFMNFIRR